MIFAERLKGIQTSCVLSENAVSMQMLVPFAEQSKCLLLYCSLIYNFIGFYVNSSKLPEATLNLVTK